MSFENKQRSMIAMPVSLISVGAGWLLEINYPNAPVDWFISILLALAAFLSLLYLGINRFSFIFAGFLISCDAILIIRSLGKVSPEKAMPLLFIIVGLLLLAANIIFRNGSSDNHDSTSKKGPDNPKT